MMVSLLANFGIILLNIYFIWKVNLEVFEQNYYPKLKTHIYVAAESFFGILLLTFSVVIMEAHFDFRFVLYAMSMKYLGEKVTLPTILILGLFRFLHEGFLPATMNMVIVIVLLLSYSKVYQWSKKYFEDLGQMLTLAYYYLLVSFPLSFFILDGYMKSVILYLILLFLATIMIFVIQNVTKDIQYLASLSELDNLTNLFNSRKFYEDIKKLSNNNRAYALIVMDIDNFKAFNDRYGHLVGDAVLREIAKVLSSMSHDKYFFYRYGGEEFVALIEDCSGEKAVKLAEDIQTRIRVLRVFTDEGEELEVTVSIGVAHKLSKEDLIETFKRADNALYQAKENGKNQIMLG